MPKVLRCSNDGERIASRPWQRRGECSRNRKVPFVEAWEAMEAKCLVLIVDDDVDGADTLGTLMQLEGHDVRVCYAAVQALEVALAFRPDVCSLDIGLPDFDGLEVARAMRAMYGPGQLLIALSGYAMARDVAAGRMAEFDYYLAKPEDVKDLLVLFPQP